MPLLTSLGLISLAVGGLSGWLVLATVTSREWFTERGLANPRAFLQAHLDWVMMGLILCAADFAVPERPSWITAALAFGLIVNPLLFIPLAWGPERSASPIYRAVALLSFSAASGGLLALAVHGIASG